MKRTAQSGFTLIELIVVIVILGILAATALPRFIGLQGDARLAKAQAILGSIRSAAALAHAAALTRSQADGTIAMEGANINMVNFYPTAARAGIISAAQLDPNDPTLTISADAAAAGGAITIDINGGATPANCRISYASPATSGNAAAITTVNALDANNILTLAGCS